MQIKNLISDSELTGRFSKYELFTEKIVDKSMEEYNAELEKVVAEKNKYYRIPWRWREMDPRYFIVPTKDATYLETPSNPFDFYPQILLDFIEMAKKIEEDEDEMKKDKDEVVAKRILNFCNRYGLFNISGFYSVAFFKGTGVDFDGDGYSPYEYDKVLLSRPGIESLWTVEEPETTMPTHNFIDHFISESWDGYDNILKDKENLHKNLMRNYHSEPVYYAKKEILELYWRFERWFEYLDKKEDPWVVKDEVSNYLMSEPMSVSVDYNGVWRLKWIYGNLIAALNIMFLHSVIEKNQKILFCENEYCKAPFIVNKNTQIYCSPSCRDAARFRRHYNKKKGKQ